MKEKALSLLKELNYITDNLRHEMKTLSYEQLNYKSKDDKWSVSQILNHLLVSEKLSLKYCKKKLSFSPSLKKIGFLSRLRNLVLKAYILSPFKFNAPKMVGTSSLPDYDTLNNIVKTWKEQRLELESFIKELPEESFGKELYKHPVVGRISIIGMIKFFILHFNNHHKQIKKALS